MHLPWSLGFTSDDKALTSLGQFKDVEVVVTEKMDGENSTLYRDYLHARSIDGRSHVSRDWLKQYHASFAYMIDEGVRICGENLFAKHSIFYPNLKSYFYGFSVWDENNCWSWDDTVEYLDMLGVQHAPVLFRGVFDAPTLINLATDMETNVAEGYVVRPVQGFSGNEFGSLVGKFVRAEHVQTDQHWMTAEVVPNGLI